MKDWKGFLKKHFKQLIVVLLAIVIVVSYSLSRSSDRTLRAGGFPGEEQPAPAPDGCPGRSPGRPGRCPVNRRITTLIGRRAAAARLISLYIGVATCAKMNCGAHFTDVASKAASASSPSGTIPLYR